MANILSETLAGTIPSLGLSTGGMASGLKFAGIVLIVGCLTALIGYLVLDFLKYNKKVVIFRKVGSQIVPAVTDRGWFQRIGKAGDYWCKLKKSKKILPRPRIQIAKNEYWFYEREDGEWINFTLGDFDEQAKRMGAHMVDEDMRLHRIAIEKNLEQRYNKMSFFDKYGAVMFNIGAMIIVMVMLIILFEKMQESWTLASQMAAAVRDMAEQVANMQARTMSGAIPTS